MNGATYETRDRYLVAFLQKGSSEMQIGAAKLRWLAKPATDHERRAVEERGGA